MKKRRTRGFTLIELMVVIAIVVFLSSVIFAALASARSKAREKAFKTEVLQLVNAIELYKNDTGKYPGEQFTSDATGPYYQIVNSAGAISTSSIPANFNLADDLKPYLSRMPNIPTNGASFLYVRALQRNCVGQTTSPKYVIKVSVNEPGFEEWPYYMYTGVTDINFRCFSLE